MGITDLFADFYSALSFTEAHAEAQQDENDDDKSGPSDEGKEDDDKSEDSEEGASDEGKEEGGDDDAGGDEEEDEEEEEDDEPVDPKPKLEEECANSAQCAPAKHHFEECVSRVTAQHQDASHKGPKEDCVEEFFHLQHCATQCAAPKLFKLLK